MKLKCKAGDFRVSELLDERYLSEHGPHQLYLVRKRKLTTDEAARVLAREAEVPHRSVRMAGLKDKQAVTLQYMSIEGGRQIRYEDEFLSIEPIGRAAEPYSSHHSFGNAFEITVRDLSSREIASARAAIPPLREFGLPNYFDDQRFGNLRHDQGWVGLELMRGRFEHALGTLVCAPSPHDDARQADKKHAFERAWGDWSACLRIARRSGEHQGVFESLVEAPQDFTAALQRVPLRIRLIHLYAWQSHLWNRAVSGWVARQRACEPLALDSVDGPLWCWGRAWPEGVDAETSFRLPGQGLEDVKEPLQRQLFEDALAEHRLVGSQFRIDGLKGFQPKGEDRPLVLLPRKLRAKPPSPDNLHPARYCLRLTFELPRAAYATLIVKRLFASEAPRPAEGRRPAAPRQPWKARTNRRSE
jgi:tRNA pseudouridine13 synthase